MSYQELNPNRSRLIDSICSLGPIYIMTIFIEMDMSWWRYIIGLVAFLVVAGLYAAVFRRFVCPKDTDEKDITKSRKYLSYLLAFIFTIIGIIVYDILPFNVAVNLAISIVVNFVLIMGFCYFLAKK